MQPVENNSWKSGFLSGSFLLLGTLTSVELICGRERDAKRLLPFASGLYCHRKWMKTAAASVWLAVLTIVWTPLAGTQQTLSI